MRIISKFRDYYDGCMGLGQDETLVWVRSTGELPVRGTPLESGWINIVFSDLISKKQKNTEVVLAPGLLVVAGKCYPFVKAQERVHEAGFKMAPTKTKISYFYEAGDVANFLINEHGIKADEGVIYNYIIDKPRLRDLAGLSTWIIEMAKTPTALKQWLIENRIAVAVMGPSDNAPNAQVDTWNLVVNPILKPMSAFRVLPSAQAYQELSMYIGGVLPTQSAMPTEIEDKYRIAQHGFDKHSFRSSLRKPAK